ncbi:uncharacterized protein LOC111164914 isoform X4 [Delphinapterus leucas]|uniref:Uncharacterized protein LOC111164914 isoform X4 n=1 Tax=Delphinapterus leucas TaxID=9749 RepID=A0A2Y9LUD9_DELLE|nr:uncharacterized protein LOC111164914 isoform X4 [Delphinapterus leucas]
MHPEARVHEAEGAVVQLPGPQRVARAHTEEGEERSLPEPCAVCVYPLRPRSRPCRREELRLTRGNVTCPRPHSCEGHQQDWQPGRLAPGNIRCGACLVMTDGTPGVSEVSRKSLQLLPGRADSLSTGCPLPPTEAPCESNSHRGKSGECRWVRRRKYTVPATLPSRESHWRGSHSDVPFVFFPYGLPSPNLLLSGCRN